MPRSPADRGDPWADMNDDPSDVPPCDPWVGAEYVPPRDSPGSSSGGKARGVTPAAGSGKGWGGEPLEGR